ncbi:MAG: PTS transporter subunit EIIA [Chloroflexi bacterium]|nr:PTS transporter subunit EIIA [Chloroflexota bacterium]
MNLKDLLVSDAIVAKLDLLSRDQVIEKAGGLLVSAGTVLPQYIEAMRKVMEDLGPYCVIAPGIALLHARPENGVIRSSLALVTLKHPICFGHSTNDPVDLAFALAANDKKSHIDALAELAGYLSESNFLRVLRENTNSLSLKNSIFSYIDNRK